MGLQAQAESVKPVTTAVTRSNTLSVPNYQVEPSSAQVQYNSPAKPAEPTNVPDNSGRGLVRKTGEP